MNKLLLSLILGIFVLQANAQFTMTTHDEVVIENGDTFTFNTTDEETAKLGYIVHNDTESTIIMKAQIEEITGSDGTDFELCFGGSCYFSVTEGLIIPQSPVAIPAGGIQGMYDHMWNKSSSSSYMTFKVKFFMLDSFGSESGEPFYVNYIYNENLGVQDLNPSFKAQVKNTIVKDVLILDLNENSVLNIFSVDGKLVKTMKANQGNQSVNLSNLTPGQYIVVINNASGKSTSTKVLVK